MNHKFLMKVWKLQKPKKGYFFCLTTINNNSKKILDHFFKWPINKEELDNHIKKYPMESYNHYFCPTPFINPRRKKAYVIGSKLLWADLDESNPSIVTGKQVMVITLHWVFLYMVI